MLYRKIVITLATERRLYARQVLQPFFGSVCVGHNETTYAWRLLRIRSFIHPFVRPSVHSFIQSVAVNVTQTWSYIKLSLPSQTERNSGGLFSTPHAKQGDQPPPLFACPKTTRDLSTPPTPFTHNGAVLLHRPLHTLTLEE